MKLFESWTFSLPLPEPAAALSEDEGTNMSMEAGRCSVHNNRRAVRKAMLHGPTLRALSCLEKITCRGAGAAGVQADSSGNIQYYFLEYEDSGGRYALLYNPDNGEIKQKDGAGATVPMPVSIESGRGDGKYILLMFAFAGTVCSGPVYDKEFSDKEAIYCAKTSSPDREYLDAAYVCCDNLYRRVMEKKIPCCSRIADEGIIPQVTEEELELYRPNKVLYGDFRIFRPQDGEGRLFKTAGTAATVKEAAEKYHMGLTLTKEEESRIPDIPEDYLVLGNADNILRKITRTNMRIFMLRGEAGTGKTTTVQIIARCLGLPYYYFCCGEGTEETDLISSYLPNTGTKEGEGMPQADWTDFIMDPADVVCGMTGVYEEGIGMQDAFTKLLLESYRSGIKDAESRKDFLLVESDLVKGCRRPSVVELQEPTVIGRAGTLVKLNSLLDGCASITLSDGEVVHRHPDTVIIMTTNTAYNGCSPLNQSVLSRLNLLIDEDSLTEKDMVDRVMVKTGCSDRAALLKMAETILDIKRQFSDVVAMGGICGYREYEDWVCGWMESGDWTGELKNAVVSKMCDQADVQQDILSYAKVTAGIPKAA